MCAIKKVTKETRRRPRADVLRTPVPCAPRSAEGRCGNSLRSDTRTSSPSPDLRCSARYKGGPEDQDQRQEHPRMAWYWVQLWRLISGPPCSEPSIAGESGAQRRRCLSAASSAPSPDSPRSAGHRCAAPARGWRRVSLVTFFARAKKVTPPRRRGNGPPGMARRYRRVGAQTKTPGARPGVPALLYKRRLTPPSTPAARRCALPAAGGS